MTASSSKGLDANLTLSQPLVKRLISRWARPAMKQGKTTAELVEVLAEEVKAVRDELMQPVSQEALA